MKTRQQHVIKLNSQLKWRQEFLGEMGQIEWK